MLDQVVSSGRLIPESLRSKLWSLGAPKPLFPVSGFVAHISTIFGSH